MLKFIRRAFSIKRLIRELEEKEAKIATLETELRVLRNAPTFQSVATPIDVGNLPESIRQKVIGDLATILRRDAVDCLVQGFHGIERQGLYRVSGMAALDARAAMVTMEFRINSAGTRIEVYEHAIKLRR
ncbi:hypothetical protein [Sagittula salina]|uniref:Uncharacterized protein n=1 Tax=Sagittula salina TaxID=2820268 RepID=A0A940S566_9RHOB|nr:hypothetical protein [Sagittula salina]MBP0484655.1 hypothetical protein [Sagittula salina]